MFSQVYHYLSTPKSWWFFSGIVFILITACAGLQPQARSETLPQQPSQYHLTAILQDSMFQHKDSIQVELLETGEILAVRFNAPFQLNLPLDTLWNLCFDAENLEKCYVLKYFGSDSSFRFSIDGNDQVTWYNDESVERLAQIPDTSADTAVDTVDVEKLLAEQTNTTTQLKKVVVQLRKRPKRRLGESVVSAKRIKRLPGLAEADVIRTIQALPGVVASSDFSTKIYVRGGGADQNLFLFDNGVVYSPVHFFGLFSTFLVEGIDDVKFYKGGFAPSYGNRLSSVVDIRSRLGGQDTVDAWFDKSSLKISTFASQAHTEGHQGNHRWLVAGRTTYIKQMLDLLKKTKITDFTLDYKFTDLQANYRYTFGPDRWIAFSVYTGEDVLNFDPIKVDWGNDVIPLNFHWRFNQDWSYQATASYSDFSQNFSLKDIFSMENGITTYSLKQSVLYEGFNDHRLSFGLENEYDKVTFIEDIEMYNERFEDNPKPSMHSMFIQDNWTPEAWDFLYGIRLTYQDLAAHWGLEPRFSASRKLPNSQTVSFHLGYYYQYLNSILFSDMESLNEFYYPAKDVDGNDMNPSGSALLSLGYNVDNLFNDWTFTAETYYKTQNDLFIYDSDSESEEGAEEFKSIADFFKTGKGYSFGYELSLRKNAGPVAGGISWSQGWSVIREQNDSVAYFPDWHQPYAFKADIAFNWRGKDDAIWKPSRPKQFLRSSVQVKLASGLPYTEYLGYQRAYDIDQSTGFASGGPSPEFVDGIATRYGNRNTNLQPDYFRLDIKLLDWGIEGKWNFSWTILNVTNHENVFLITYDTSKNPPEKQTMAQFPFFPILVNYEYYF